MPIGSDISAAVPAAIVPPPQSPPPWGTISGTLSDQTDLQSALDAKASTSYVDNAILGLLDFKGSQDCSSNPNYPSALKGDVYMVSVAGKIGGASGATVEAGDLFTATLDNAGGTQASVGGSWVITERNIAFGTGVSTALGIAIGSPGAPVLFNGAGGTPSSINLSNGTTLPNASVTGLGTLATVTPGTGVATFATTPSSANLAAAVTDETGSGALVFATSPTLVTPLLGTPTSGNLANCTALPAAGVTGTAVTQTTLSNASLPASFTTLVASTSGNQHTLTNTFSGTVTFDSANVFAIRHTLGNGASAMAVLRHSDGFEMGAFGYKNVGAASTYLDGAIYVAGGIYNSSTGASASATPPKIIIGQEASGTGVARMVWNTDWSVDFNTSNGTLHTHVGPTGGWLIGSSSATATNQILDAIGKTCLGDWTNVTDRNTQSSGWGVTIMNTSTNANLLRMVKNNVGKMDIQYNGTSGTRRIDFLDTDNSTTPLSLDMAGTGAATIAGNVIVSTAGKGLQLKSGTGARAGNAVLVGGTVTVANTTVTANSIIYPVRKTAGGTLGQSLSYTVSAGTSFTITSVDATGVLSALDTSTVSFIIIELN